MSNVARWILLGLVFLLLLALSLLANVAFIKMVCECD